jgi:uncharacterized membrane protein YeiH
VLTVAEAAGGTVKDILLGSKPKSASEKKNQASPDGY